MKSKLAFALFLVALLPVVSGSQEVVEMGPYNVSFDLGDLNYSVEIDVPYDGETYSGLNYTHWGMLININSTSVCEINVNQFYNESFREFGEIYDIYNKILIEHDTDMTVHPRTIDGKDVALFVGSDDNGSAGFIAMYALESDGWIDTDGTFTANYRNDYDAMLFGNNIITIVIGADWDIARNLLNTIHIELRDGGDNKDI